jgi:hypothetical protein
MAGTSPERQRGGHRPRPRPRPRPRLGILTGHGLLASAGATAAVLALAQAPAPADTAHAPPAAVPAATGGSNGIEQLSARQIADRTKKALLSAGSLHARLTDSSARTSRHRPSAADLTLDRKGNCTGGLTFGTAGHVAVVKRGDEVWLRPDSAFLKQQVPHVGGLIARVLRGRYVHGDLSNGFLRRVTRFCDLDTFRKEVEAATTGAGNLGKGRPTTVAGTRTVPLTGRQGNRSSTLYVSAEGTPYPLKTVVKGNQKDLVMTLNRFDQPVPSKTPSGSDSVDVSKLQQQLQG